MEMLRAVRCFRRNDSFPRLLHRSKPLRQRSKKVVGPRLLPSIAEATRRAATSRCGGGRRLVVLCHRRWLTCADPSCIHPLVILITSSPPSIVASSTGSNREPRRRASTGTANIGAGASLLQEILHQYTNPPVFFDQDPESNQPATSVRLQHYF